MFSPSEKIGYIIYHDYNVGSPHLKQWASDIIIMKMKQHLGFCCKKAGYFTKPVKNITNEIFICFKQIIMIQKTIIIVRKGSKIIFATEPLKLKN